jgi:hypothetical protein
MFTELTFITNKARQSRTDRFSVLVGADIRLFDRVVEYSLPHHSLGAQ